MYSIYKSFLIQVMIQCEYLKKLFSFESLRILVYIEKDARGSVFASFLFPSGIDWSISLISLLEKKFEGVDSKSNMW